MEFRSSRYIGVTDFIYPTTDVKGKQDFSNIQLVKFPFHGAPFTETIRRGVAQKFVLSEDTNWLDEVSYITLQNIHIYILDKTDIELIQLIRQKSLPKF